MVMYVERYRDEDVVPAVISEFTTGTILQHGLTRVECVYVRPKTMVFADGRTEKYEGLNAVFWFPIGTIASSAPSAMARRV